MAEHDLEDVAGGDVVLGRGDHAGEGVLVDGRVEDRGRDLDRRRARRQRGPQLGLEPVQPGDGGVVGGAGGLSAVRIGGRDQHDLVPHGVENGDEGGTGQDGVRQVQRVGIGRSQRLQQPDHVIAEHAEQARGHGRQVIRQVKPRGGDQGAQGLQCRCRVGREPAGGECRAPGTVGPTVAAAPDHVRIAGDDRIAAVDGPALDGFQQKGIGPAVADLQKGRDRGLEVVNQPADDDLGPTVRPAGGEGAEARRPRCRTHWTGAASGSRLRPRASRARPRS